LTKQIVAELICCYTNPLTKILTSLWAGTMWFYCRALT